MIGNIAERAINDDIEDKPIDFGEFDDDVDGDDPKPDDDAKKTPTAPPKAPTMSHMSKGTAGDGVIYLNDIGETVKFDKKGAPIQGWK